MNNPFSSHNRFRRGFTLVEVLVSSVLIVAIMALLLSTVDQTQRVWQRTRSKTTQFQAARAGFELMSRRLSQATLNTYWRTHESIIATENANFRFRRQSDLQFISGPTQRFLKGAIPIKDLNEPIEENYPGHAMFFHAPLGYTERVDPNSTNVTQFHDLESAICACGYYVEFGDDPAVPSFLRTMTPPVPPHYRYRLWEMNVPTEMFNIYARPKNSDRLIDPRVFSESSTTAAANYYDGMVNPGREPRLNWTRPLWMKEALARISVSSAKPPFFQFKYARPLAENVIALIVLPKLAEKDRSVPNSNPPVADPNSLELAPWMEFDSWRTLTGATQQNPDIPAEQMDNRARDNLLPPIVQLTMVAIDEPSSVRMDLKLKDKPNWTDKLFPQPGIKVDKISVFDDNLTQLESRLRDDPKYPNINYRIFTTDVVIRGSKWSRDP